MLDLRFGIPELDRMLDTERDTAELSEIDGITSLAILGPDGTGKSILAFHMAARYFADCAAAKSTAKVVYISTDMNYDSALKVWNKFHLTEPNRRDIPLERATERKSRRNAPVVAATLKPLQPSDGSTAEFLDPQRDPVVGFLDLASHSAGDDWRYINRLLSLLEES